MLQFVMKPEAINSVDDFFKYLKSTKSASATDMLAATKRLIDIYGEKIIPGGALDEELNEDEKIARIAYVSAHEQLKDTVGGEFKKYDNLYEKAATLKFKSKRFFPKLFWGIFVAMIFLALFKYLFS